MAMGGGVWVATRVRVQAGKRLAALGGTLPDMKDIPRRRAPADARR